MTNHTHVLLCLAQDSCMRIRDIATTVGITERAVQRIIRDLENDGYIQRQREGRRNVYEINQKLKLRHPLEKHRNITGLIELICGEDSKVEKTK